MNDLTSLLSSIEENVLYIIGNGFDLAHKMKTSYEDFHQWLLENGESNAVRRLEMLYPDIRNDIGCWCDLESALGSVSLKEAIDYDKYYQDCSDDLIGEYSSHAAYRCGENLKNAVDIIPGLLKDWIASISTEEIRQRFKIDNNSKFLSFNYTRTLEDVYHIKEENVLHIHGIVINNRPLVVGYGEAMFEEEDYVTSDDEIDINYIKNLLSHCRKPVNVILQEPIPKTWFNNLNEVSNVIVYGHSCTDVDQPYFLTVAKKIKSDALWTFFVHNKSRNKEIEAFAKSVIKENQMFEITND